MDDFPDDLGTGPDDGPDDGRDGTTDASAEPTGATGGALSLDDLPSYTGVPVEAGNSSSWSGGRIVALVTGLLVLIGGVAFAVTSSSGGSGGGSPEDAVRRLLDAAAAEDVIGVLEALDPAERDALRPGVEALFGELERLGLLEGADLRGFQGTDVEFLDVELETEQVADDVAKVRPVGGVVVTAADPAELPLGRNIPDEATADAEPTSDRQPIADGDTFFGTVRRDGDWYVSIGYTIAEAAREDAGVAFPDESDWLQPEGADTPSGVADALLEAASELDVRRLFALMAPGEMDPLHRYAPLYLPDLEAATADAFDEGNTFTVDVLEVSEDVQGNTARLTIEQLEINVSDPDDGEFTFTYDGDCGVTEARHPVYGDDRQEFCISDLSAEEGFFGIFAAPQSALTVMTVVEVDGKWYLSPVRSALDALVQMLRLLDEDAVDSLMTLPFMFAGGESQTIGGGIDPIELGGSTSGFEDRACMDAMERYGRQASEGVPEEELGPFPPAECDFSSQFDDFGD